MSGSTPTPGADARSGRREAVRDAVPLLTAFAVVQIVLPSRYVIGPLGGAGAPARLLGLAIFLWWLTDWLAQPTPRTRIRHPLRVFALVFLAAVWISYLQAALRPTSVVEQLPVDRSLLNTLAWVGLIMVGADGIATRAGLDTLVRRITWLGGAEAALGLLQFVTHRSYVEFLHLPGLQDSGDDGSLIVRGLFVRPSGTAIHPLEFGITLSMLLPVALHYAVTDVHRGKVARWWPAALMACTLPLSISRSAIICTVVALGVLLAFWPKSMRRVVYAGAAVLTAGLAAVLPGFLGTFLDLFGGIGKDSSTTSRTDSYGIAWAFISRAPFFGRGTGSFLPRYRILDNQYLGSLIEIGVVGVVAMLALFVAGVVTGCRIVEPPRPDVPGLAGQLRLGPALGACIAGGGASFAFFDAWAFPMIPSMMFLVLGCIAGLRRLSIEGDRTDVAVEPPVVQVSPQAAP